MRTVPGFSRRWLAVAAALSAVALACAVPQAGFFLDRPAQAPESADLIAPLGGDGGDRARLAAELYRRGFAPKVLLAGREGGQAADWRAGFLLGQGVPLQDLLFDGRSANSWEEAVNTLRLMRERNMRRVLVVSQPPHLRRLDWAWGKVFAGSGKEYRLIASPMAEWDAAHWWRNAASAQYVAKEYLKLGYYWMAH